MSLYEHIHPDFRYVMDLTDKERMAFLYEPRWIEYQAAATVLGTLQDMLQTPHGLRTRNLMIVGDSNNGKTALFKRFQDLLSRGDADVAVEPAKPVIIDGSRLNGTEKDFYLAILSCFSAPYVSDSTRTLCDQVISLCRVLHVRMFVIDDFHMLMDSTPRRRQDILKAIKILCNELLITVVLVGFEETKQTLHELPQLAARFNVMSLPLWSLDSEFLRLLASFEMSLPLKRPSELSGLDLAAAIYEVSGGTLGRVRGFLVECAREAIVSGLERIDLTVVCKVKQAWEWSDGR